MKVMLLKDTKGMGRAYDVLETSDGYALNYLIPTKTAVAATETALREAALRKVQQQSRSELSAKLLEQNLATLAVTPIVIAVKANEKGHLYDAIGERDISHAVKEQARIDLPENAIKLEKPIKELGVFEVPVAAGSSFGRFSLTIEAKL